MFFNSSSNQFHKDQGHYNGGDLFAFTLGEVVVSMGIGMALLGFAALTMVSLYQDFTGAMAYRNIHENARLSLAFLSRDIRSASNLVAFASSDITLNVVNSDGSVGSVRYQLINNNLQRTATTGAVTVTNMLTDNVTSVNFERWTDPGTPATQNSNTYEIRVELTITNLSNLRVISATDLLQSRALMRNKLTSKS